MSAAQPGPRSRHGRQETVTLGPGPAGFGMASTSGEGPRPHLPRTRRAGAVAFLEQTSANSPADRPEQPADESVSAASADTARPALTPPPLAGADLYDWMALRRVSGGGIAKMGDHWFDHGRRIPGYVADALTVLCDNGVVTLAELDAWGMQRAAMTNTGTARHQQLRRQRQIARQLSDPESAPGVTWLADHPHARNVVQSVWDTLAELEQSGYYPGAIAALRLVLAHHQPTPAGRCRACRRWRCRRRRFPCIVWHQIRAAL
ncbi:MAG: hypothetical protein ACRDRO_14755 [Pseudonocardiaceae bacterium]